MSYATLTAACALFSFQFVFSKRYQLQTDHRAISTFWMSTFDGIWLFVIFIILNGFSFYITPISAVYAICYSLFSLFCNTAALVAMRNAKVAMVSLFLLAGGLVLPALYGVVWLKEALTLQKEVGLGLILLSFLPGALFAKQHSAKKSQSSPKTLWMLYIAVFLCNGLVAVCVKAQSVEANVAPEKDFLIFAALVRVLLSFLFIAGFAFCKKNVNWLPVQSSGANGKANLKKMIQLFFVICGYTLCNGFGNFFSMITAKSMDSSLQFPMISGAVVVLTALVTWVIYHEKPTISEAMGIGITVLGIVIMVL